MNLLLKAVAVAALTVIAASGLGCSIMDPSDRQELRNKISALPPENISLLKRMTMNAKALKWLRGRPDGDQMGKLQCRYMANGEWAGWNDQEPTYTVGEMLECLLIQGIAVTYTMCAQAWESLIRQNKQTDLLNGEPVPGGSGVECKYVWDFRYAPENVSPKLTDPDSITVDDIIDAMIASPTPPPGWLFPDLVPMLCPLGAGDGWGCPDRVGDPGSGDAPEPDHP